MGRSKPRDCCGTSSIGGGVRIWNRPSADLKHFQAETVHETVCGIHGFVLAEGHGDPSLARRACVQLQSSYTDPAEHKA
jgi:hypothetical protein